jgi:MFS family permease
VVLIGGVAGTWLGGWIGDRVGRGNPAGYALVPAVCFLLAAPIYAAALFAPSLAVGFILFLIPQALGLAWLGPVIAAVQHIVPPAMRATASAAFLFINNLIGIGFGTWFVGRMSEAMKPVYGDESLRYSILYTLGFYLLSSALYFLAARRLGATGTGRPERGYWALASIAAALPPKFSMSAASSAAASLARFGSSASSAWPGEPPLRRRPGCWPPRRHRTRRAAGQERE